MAMLGHVVCRWFGSTSALFSEDQRTLVNLLVRFLVIESRKVNLEIDLEILSDWRGDFSDGSL
jgi:hypothetical protein